MEGGRLTFKVVGTHNPMAGYQDRIKEERRSSAPGHRGILSLLPGKSSCELNYFSLLIVRIL